MKYPKGKTSFAFFERKNGGGHNILCFLLPGGGEGPPGRENGRLRDFPARIPYFIGKPSFTFNEQYDKISKAKNEKPFFVLSKYPSGKKYNRR